MAQQRYRAPVRAGLDGDRHAHVYGANLGVRADAYLAVGGFPPDGSGEDHGLWRRLRATSRPGPPRYGCALRVERAGPEHRLPRRGERAVKRAGRRPLAVDTGSGERAHRWLLYALVEDPRRVLTRSVRPPTVDL